MTEQEVSNVRVSITPEQAALLAEHGIAIQKPHRSTVLRRQARKGRPFPVISRSGRGYRQPDGRIYGEVDPSEQRQADAKYWRPGVAVRDAREPMTVAVGGVVERIHEVLDWEKDGESGKWIAVLGRTLTNTELDREYPDYPYRIGDSCPTRQGGAYRPEVY